MQSIKSLGQNFLVHPQVSRKIVNSSNPGFDDVYLEVGPGKGALSFELAPVVKKLICVEKDYRMIMFLKKKISDSAYSNVELIHDDILQYQPSENIDRKYKVIGSLPYNISKRIIRKFLTIKKNRPKTLTFVIQKEVAEDYCAQAPNATFLSNMANLYADCSFLFKLRPDHFKPRPRVDSAVIQFMLHKPEPNAEKKVKFIKRVFMHPRKKVKNNVKIDTNCELLDLRPAQLNPEQMQKLFLLYNSQRNENKR